MNVVIGIGRAAPVADVKAEGPVCGPFCVHAVEFGDVEFLADAVQTTFPAEDVGLL